jgi:molybdopterin-guanine dinucleotide biosynthesis protein A
MKEAKAHLRFDNKPQWQRAQEALSAYCDQVYFSVSDQLAKPLDVDAHLLIHDQVQSCGPLGGIISAFKKNPHQTWFVLACDMPYFTSKAAQELVAQHQPLQLATCFHDAQNLPEPLCALYEPAIFEELLKAWSRGAYCPRALLKNLDTNLCAPSDKNFITNINYPKDWEFFTQDNPKNNLVITVQYYASLRQRCGCSEEELSTDAKNIAELYNHVAYKYNLSYDESSLRFAKNDELVSPKELITDGDKIIILPPVSGG